MSVNVAGGGTGGVTQDQDGYIVLDDQPGEGGSGNETAIINRTFSGIYSNHELEHIGEYGLAYLPGVTEFDLPNVKTITNSGLASNNGITKIFLPSFQNTTLNHIFSYCNNLRYIILPALNMTAAVNWIAYNDYNLEAIDWGAVSGGTARIGNNAFFGCRNLQTIVLRQTESVVPLSNITALTPSNYFKDGGTGGTLYVPESMISSYQSATNWSTILSYTNNQIVKIEGSTYETHYVDGTSIE